MYATSCVLEHKQERRGGEGLPKHEMRFETGPHCYAPVDGDYNCTPLEGQGGHHMQFDVSGDNGRHRDC